MIFRRLALLAAVSTVSLCGLAKAQEAALPKPADLPVQAAPQGSDYSLTIYSSADPYGFDPQEAMQQQLRQQAYGGIDRNSLPGYGVVREVRKIHLDQGLNTVNFTDVAAAIDPTTVSFQSLTAPNAAAVLEQNFEFDLVNSSKLIQKYLDKTIRVSRSGEGKQAEVITGKLLSFDGSRMVIQAAGGPVRIIAMDQSIDDIQLTDAAGLITKPTLVWKIENEQAGDHDVQLTYQTAAMTWRADYNITLSGDDKTADVGAWVTILNQSGGSYPNAKLKLVAGNVNRIQRNEMAYDNMAPRAMMAKGAGGAQFEEKSFFEYHMYTLGRQTTLNNNSTKQIELFPAKSNVPVKKTFVYYGVPVHFRSWNSDTPAMDRDLGIQSNKDVDVYLILDNKEQNGLGLPLPAGRIRVYKMDDADKSMEFVGEDKIDHTPKDEKVLVKLGSAFDIKGERRQTDFKVDVRAHIITESYEIKLRNHKDEPVEVIVKENLYRWNNWEITESSDKFEKQDSRTIHIPVTVDKDGEKVVTYTVKYTW